MFTQADYLYENQRRQDEMAEAAENLRQKQLLGLPISHRPRVWPMVKRAFSTLFRRPPSRGSGQEPSGRPRFS